MPMSYEQFILAPVQILRTEKKIPITKRTTSLANMEKKGVRSFVYLTVRPWAS